MSRTILFTLAVFGIAACGGGDAAPAEEPAGSSTAAAATGASAAIYDAAGRSLGEITLSDADGGILLSGELRGIAPGPHGFHIHETGVCEAPFASAGGHWNPSGRKHGLDNAEGPHQGDLVNLAVGEDSVGAVGATTPGGTLAGLLDADGAAVVVHETADDNVSDPAGNSGARIACGVIRQNP